MLPSKKLLPALLMIIAASAALFTSSCNIINPTEPVPTYVHIDSFALVHNDSLQAGSEGTFSRKITAVYVYFNNNPVGVFNPPVTFPVIANAPGQLSMFPAIDVNGLSGVELRYPFYTADTFTLQPQPGMTVNRLPVTRYPTGSQFPFSDNFDAVNFPKFSLVTGSAGSNYSIVLHNSPQPDNVFEGDGSGHIQVQNAGDTAVITSDSFIPNSGVEAYVELNYKGDIPAQIGFVATSSYIGEAPYVIGLKPRDTWGKFYVPFRAFIASHSGIYRMLVRVQAPTDKAGGNFYIDNVKVITF